jgi:ubiquinone/menaquinone biosynthesis C-methylase UbiE
MSKSDQHKLSSLRAYDGRRAARYDSSLWLKVFSVEQWDDAIVEFLEPHLHGASVLDVGCATGRLLFRLARAGAASVSGVDLSPGMITEVLSRVSAQSVPMNVRLADFETNLPFPDCCFDIITLTAVLHHVVNTGPLFSELRRVARPKSIMIIAESEYPTIMRRIMNFCLKYVTHKGDRYFRSPTEVVKVAQSQGWNVTQIVKMGRSSFFIAGFRI